MPSSLRLEALQPRARSLRVWLTAQARRSSSEYVTAIDHATNPRHEDPLFTWATKVNVGCTFPVALYALSGLIFYGEPSTLTAVLIAAFDNHDRQITIVACRKSPEARPLKAGFLHFWRCVLSPSFSTRCSSKAPGLARYPHKIKGMT